MLTCLPSPLVSAVIVNYNAGPLLARCLASLAAQTLPDLEIIIIDNASSDRSLPSALARLAAGLPPCGNETAAAPCCEIATLPCREQAAAPCDDITAAAPICNSTASRPVHSTVRVVRNPRNLGFAAAQNQGLRLAQADYLLPLNFDVLLTPTFLSELVAALEANHRLGSVAGKLLYLHPSGVPTRRLYALGHLLPPDRFPLLRGAGQPDRGQYDTPGPVFGAPGAAPLYRRAMLEDIAYRGQYFDESYFMWYEDVDLDWRMQLRGWSCQTVPRAVAYHLGHPAGYPPRFAAFQAYHSIRNRWAMIAANEKPSDFLHNLLPLAAYEISLLKHVLRAGLLKPYLLALASCLHRAPQLWRKRRWVRSRAGLPHLWPSS